MILFFRLISTFCSIIEFVHDFAELGQGNGGYNEGHEFYGYRMPL